MALIRLRSGTGAPAALLDGEPALDLTIGAPRLFAGVNGSPVVIADPGRVTALENRIQLVETNYLPLAGGTLYSPGQSGPLRLRADPGQLAGIRYDTARSWSAGVDSLGDFLIGDDTAGIIRIALRGNDNRIDFTADLVAFGNITAVGGSFLATFDVSGTRNITAGATVSGVNVVASENVVAGQGVFGVNVFATHLQASGTVLPETDDTALNGAPSRAWAGVWSHLINGSAFVQRAMPQAETTIAALPADCLDLVTAIEPRIFGAGDRWGFVADEVRTVMEAAGHDFGGVVIDPDDDRPGLRYNDLLAVLWKAVHQLADRIART